MPNTIKKVEISEIYIKIFRSDADRQDIVRGSETNYILATVTLFVSIYKLFARLLHIFGFLGGED
jgi:FtsH-binding integral membrane protein